MDRSHRALPICIIAALLSGCQGGSSPTASPPAPTIPAVPLPVVDTVSWASMGGSHTCIQSTGYADTCWGDNASGQLGQGDTTAMAAPGALIFGLDDGIDGANPPWAGGRHTCVLGYGIRTAFNALCWGDNTSGQLGDGTRTNHARATAVAASARGESIDGVNFALGARHTCGFSNTRLLCWGANESGQLGDGTTIDRPIPVEVAGDMSFAATRPLLVAAGTDHTCAIGRGGTFCWGANASGQLGNGSMVPSTVPVPVAGALAFVQITLGDRYSCALTASGAAYCWGANGDGQLGNGTSVASAIPVPVSGSLAFYSVSAGDAHVCGLARDSKAYCWGANTKGQLGDGTTVASAVPKAVASDLVFGFAGAGGRHSCGIRAQGDMYCWGDNGAGQLGNGTTVGSNVPVLVQPLKW